MANAVTAAARQAARLVPLLVKHWPKVVQTIPVVVRFVQDNPAVPAWFRERLADVPRRLAAAYARRSPAARIRATLEIVRDVARDAERADASRMTAKHYLDRANGIERGVRLAEAQSRPQQGTTFERLTKETDALLADLLEVVAQASPNGAGSVEAGPGPQ